MASIVGDAACVRGPAEIEPHVADYRRLYCGDAAAVVFPSTTAQVSDVMAWCNTHRVPVVPQGGNTIFDGRSCPRTRSRRDCPEPRPDEQGSCGRPGQRHHHVAGRCNTPCRVLRRKTPAASFRCASVPKGLARSVAAFRQTRGVPSGPSENSVRRGNEAETASKRDHKRQFVITRRLYASGSHANRPCSDLP